MGTLNKQWSEPQYMIKGIKPPLQVFKVASLHRLAQDKPVALFFFFTLSDDFFFSHQRHSQLLSICLSLFFFSTQT